MLLVPPCLAPFFPLFLARSNQARGRPSTVIQSARPLRTRHARWADKLQARGVLQADGKFPLVQSATVEVEVKTATWNGCRPYEQHDANMHQCSMWTWQVLLSVHSLFIYTAHGLCQWRVLQVVFVRKVH